MLTFKELSEKYLSWCKSHQATRTHEWYSGYLEKFIGYPGVADTPCDELKPYQVQEWIDSHGKKWGSTYRGGAVVAVKRVYNWATEQGYVAINPIQKMKKASAQRREIYMTLNDYQDILSHVASTDPFYDFVEFMWYSGSRPQECRHIERRHVDLQRGRIVFPVEESKGKRAKRIIQLHGKSLEIITKLMADGKRQKELFLNTRGEAWSKFAICNRYHRISEMTGKRMFAYATRHGFGTRKLIQGHDHLTVAALMGHTDGSMLAKIYSHISDDDAHLKAALAD